MKLAAATDFRVVHEDWGDETRTLIVRASDEDRRDWVAASPLVGQLASRNIANVGITWAKRSFEMVRPQPDAPFFMACFDGSGAFLHDAVEQPLGEGRACLLPPDAPNHLQMGDSAQWTYAFVRYRAPIEGQPAIATPRIGDYDPLPLVEAVRGLYAESNGNASASALQLWVELIHGYVLQFLHPRAADIRVAQAWETVVSQLDRRWTANQIAAEAAMSGEHFRRLCQESLGCSPMKHLSHLRMRRASELLATTELTIDAISLSVGYQFASTFSNTFQKWSGLRPSEFRRTT